MCRNAPNDLAQRGPCALAQCGDAGLERGSEVVKNTPILPLLGMRRQRNSVKGNLGRTECHVYQSQPQGRLPDQTTASQGRTCMLQIMYHQCSTVWAIGTGALLDAGGGMSS